MYKKLAKVAIAGVMATLLMTDYAAAKTVPLAVPAGGEQRISVRGVPPTFVAFNARGEITATIRNNTAVLTQGVPQKFRISPSQVVNVTLFPDGLIEVTAPMNEIETVYDVRFPPPPVGIPEDIIGLPENVLPMADAVKTPQDSSSENGTDGQNRTAYNTGAGYEGDAGSGAFGGDSD